MRPEKYIDISMIIQNHMRHYPTDPEVSLEPYHSIEAGDPYRSTKITLSSHTGSHIDAPRHLLKDGPSIDNIVLEDLIGPCQVVDVGAVMRIDLTLCEGLIEDQPKRVLFKTDNSRPQSRSQDGDLEVGLTYEASVWLASNHFILVGIDGLSIESDDDSDFKAHKALLKSGVVIIEGLDLSKVDTGHYNLICLPMPLTGIDGAPVRAVLYRD